MSKSRFINLYPVDGVGINRYRYLLSFIKLVEYVADGYKPINNSIYIALDMKRLSEGISINSSLKVVVDYGGSAKEFTPKQRGSFIS